jgi:hypothetical protein
LVHAVVQRSSTGAPPVLGPAANTACPARGLGPRRTLAGRQMPLKRRTWTPRRRGAPDTHTTQPHPCVATRWPRGRAASHLAVGAARHDAARVGGVEAAAGDEVRVHEGAQALARGRHRRRAAVTLAAGTFLPAAAAPPPAAACPAAAAAAAAARGSAAHGYIDAPQPRGLVGGCGQQQAALRPGQVQHVASVSGKVQQRTLRQQRRPELPRAAAAAAAAACGGGSG